MCTEIAQVIQVIALINKILFVLGYLLAATAIIRLVLFLGEVDFLEKCYICGSHLTVTWRRTSARGSHAQYCARCDEKHTISYASLRGNA